ncbi:tyrosine-type recombinase/integrase [Rhodococcus sp. JVH1]|uniref:tyrosine-type recombinase/integrase n=1 Tax=Rhodococcus sp. JVH1 TaxID=745408 RepID=UPI0002F21587|nr:tyrosine-type recombinase/integrase [Rhodococcus sp. JVH1]
MVSRSDELFVEDVVVPRWGRVVTAEGVVPFVVVGDDGEVLAPVAEFLRDFVARGNSAGSVRSYSFVLLRWWRWLRVVEVPWQRATSGEVRDLVLWLRQTSKPRNSARTASLATVGTVNAVTRKPYLNDRYAARTVRHNNAVLRSFYDDWIERGEGPLLNPVAQNRRGGRFPGAHWNPAEPFRDEKRLRYNPKVPRRFPRDVPDERWDELFAALRSDRDRAMLALAVSSAARAGELLGLRCCDIDWGDQLIRVVRKGTRAQQWIPASSEAFVWLRLVIAAHPTGHAGDSVWWTLRRRDRGGGLRAQPLSYDALRAVLRRVNDRLATNWTMHDLRHTCAIRMLRDARLSLRDIQVILGHAHLSTTQLYLDQDDHDVIHRVHEHLKTVRERPPATAAVSSPVGVGYDAADLAILFGQVPS